MGFFFIPNGVNIPYWTPTKEGFDFDLTPTLEPLKSFPEFRDLIVSPAPMAPGRIAAPSNAETLSPERRNDTPPP